MREYFPRLGRGEGSETSFAAPPRGWGVGGEGEGVADDFCSLFLSPVFARAGSMDGWRVWVKVGMDEIIMFEIII